MTDELNPDLMFQITRTDLLLRIARGELDPVALVKAELGNRGIGPNGRWVGFNRARIEWGIER